MISASPASEFASLEKLRGLLIPDAARKLERSLTALDQNAATAKVPVVDNGLVRWIADEEYSESFGFQWNRFEVRIQKEDEETFVVKTGVPLNQLHGQMVLDAGCGGGRYSRVAAENGARLVVGVDRSRAVDKALQLCKGLANTVFMQADLTELPFAVETFDLVFSIGVLHHGPNARQSFDSVARLVRPGGRLSVWLYRRATFPQEWINNALRRRTTRMSHAALLRWAKLGAFLGGIPLVSRIFNKVVSFSTHPVWENRVCDTFDWYSPMYQSHHTVKEVAGWFATQGFDEVRELAPANVGRAYLWAHRCGLLIGSGVNMTGVKR